MRFTATTFTCSARSGSPQAVAVWITRVTVANSWLRSGRYPVRSPTSSFMRGMIRGNRAQLLRIPKPEKQVRIAVLGSSQAVDVLTDAAAGTSDQDARWG